jgi:hypothetical protein
MNALDCWKATVESGTLSAIIPDVSGEALSRRALRRLNAIGPSILPLFDPPARIGLCVACATSSLWAPLHRSCAGDEFVDPPRNQSSLTKHRLHRRPERRYNPTARFYENRPRGVGRRNRRTGRRYPGRGRSNCDFRLLYLSRRIGARVPN